MAKTFYLYSPVSVSSIREETERGPVDPEIVQRARRGCPEALDALLRALVPPLFVLARRLTADHHHAEDLVTKTLYRGAVKIQKLREPRAAAKWFRRILLNLWRDELRSAKPREIFLEDIDEPSAARGSDPTEPVHESELREATMRAVGSLPPGQRAVLALRLEGDLSVGEIARALGTTKARVKANLWHARQRLRGLLPPAFGFSDHEEGKRT